MIKKSMNLVLIIIDTLRYDFVGYTRNYKDSITSVIDEISRDGLTYNYVFSSGTSTPFAFPGLLASSYASQHKLPGILGVKWTLSEFMRYMGYDTFGFNGGNSYVSNLFGYDKGTTILEKSYQVNGKSGFRRRIKNILEKVNMLEFSKKIYEKYTEIKRFGKYLLKSEPFILTAEKQISDFINILDQKKPRKFFAWFDFMEVHGPYLGLWKASLRERIKMYELFKSRPFCKERKLLPVAVSTYSKALSELDNQIESLLNSLDRRGLLKDALIVITSDHGEEFFEHGDYDHKPKPYDEIIRIPLIVYHHGEKFSIQEKKNESQKLISLVDIPVSILNYLFGRWPRTFIGKPTFLGGQAERNFIFSEGYARKNSRYLVHDPEKKGIRNWCIRTKFWKYMKINGKSLFFDLENDSKERNPVEPSEKHLKLINEYLQQLNREKISCRVHSINSR